MKGGVERYSYDALYKSGTVTSALAQMQFAQDIDAVMLNVQCVECQGLGAEDRYVDVTTFDARGGITGTTRATFVSATDLPHAGNELLFGVINIASDTPICGVVITQRNQWLMTNLSYHSVNH